MSAESKMRYRKTISELDLFLTGHHLHLADISHVMVADWAVEMLIRALSVSTVSRHLNCLSGLLKSAAQESMMEPVDAPRSISKALSDRKTSLPPLIDGRAYNGMLSRMRGILKKTEGFHVFEDMFLLSILEGALPLETLTNMRREDVSGFTGAGRMIVERNQSPRRDFVFDLRQSYLTPRQLSSSVAEGIRSLFSGTVIKDTVDPDGLMRSIWVACAVRNGLTASEAMGYAGGDAPYAVSGFCSPAKVESDNRRQWINAVNSVLLHDMPRWYAMHLRRGVKFDDLRKEILEKFRPVPELFYPCETIVKHTGNRKIVEEQPFISRTAFFRSHPENVAPLFSAIGDKAWCYRETGIPGSPYAVIPQRDMERFQGAVGVFTPDVEIRPLGQLSPKPGESVIVVKAGFGNRTGEVEEIVNKESGTAIFRVKLTTDSGYEFRIDVDERQLERLK